VELILCCLVKPVIASATRLMLDYPTTGRLMIEQQINNDQNNHRHTHQPAYKIFTHDAPPLKYSYNSCLFIDFGLHSSMLSKEIMMNAVEKSTG